MISSIFHTIFYDPLLNALLFLINIVPGHNFGLAIILLTLIVNFIILPFTHKSTVAQNKLKHIEPEIKEIREKFKKDQTEQGRRIMELYKKHGINPLTSFIVLLIQIPLILALYRICSVGLNFNPDHIYPFVKIPAGVNTNFLGFIDVVQKSYLMAGLAALSQFFQVRLNTPPIKKSQANDSFKDNLTRSMGLQFKYVMPVIIFIIAIRFVSAVSLYWTIMNIFGIVHASIVKRKVKNYGPTDKNNQRFTGENSGKTDG